MTDANVSTLLPENASRGAFLLGEQSSFDDSRPCQKYCVLLVEWSCSGMDIHDRSLETLSLVWTFSFEVDSVVGGTL
jgi:hypothetical protein